jgi:hypothetical protein
VFTSSRNMLKKHTQTKFQQTRRSVQTLDDKHKNTRAASMKDTHKKKEQKPNTNAADRRVEIRARGHGHAAGARILLGTRA